MSKKDLLVLILSITVFLTLIWLVFATRKTPPTRFDPNKIPTTIAPSQTQEPSSTPNLTDTIVPPSSSITPTPTPTTSVSASPIPTTPTPTTISSATPSITQTSAGTVTKLVLTSLNKNTAYKIDLSPYPSDSILVLSWPKNSALSWSNTGILNESSFVSVPIDTDGQSPESVTLDSGFLTVPTQKYFYVRASQPINTLTVSLIKPSEGVDSPMITTASTGIYNSDAGASYTSLPIKTRDEWGANTAAWDSNSSTQIDDPARLTWYPVYYKAARIIIHHTAGAVNTSDPAAAVRSVYLYHTYVRDGGWGDIGYNYLIDQNGTIYEGKLGGDETLGYHAFGSANQTSIGISLIGDFTYVRPPAAQTTALIKLLAEKAAFYGFPLKYSNGSSNFWKDVSYTVFGHRDSYRWYSNTSTWGINSTACPGNAFYPTLPTLVASAENYRQNNYTQIKNVVTEVNTSFAEPHEQGVIVVKYNYPDSVAPATIEALLPKYSGITTYTINGNTVTIPIESSIVTHPRYGDSEYLVPPMSFSGYYNEFLTYTPAYAMNGPEDRAKTLLKIFKLDPRVLAADVIHTLETQE